MNFEHCNNCNNFRGEISLSFTSFDGRLAFYLNGRRRGYSCLFVTDLKGICDIVKPQERARWFMMNGHRQFDELKSHVVDIIEPDGDCPLRTEILIESWNQ